MEAESLNEYRARVRRFFEEQLPAEWRGATTTSHGEEAFVEIRRRWGRKLFEAGFLGISWPREYGGQGLTLLEEAVFGEEQARANAPDYMNRNCISYIGPTIIAHGTEEQKRRYLPPMLSHEEVWCQGYSEPDAGSDLFSLRTKAVRRDGGFVLDGQKVWITLGNEARFCYLLARTDPALPRHKGLSAFIVDMRSPGVRVRPIKTISGAHEFSEVFLSGVVVPTENLLGGLNGGAGVATTTLGFERSINFFARVNQLREEVRWIAELAPRVQRNGKPAIEDASIVERLGRSAEDAEALRLAVYSYLPTWAKTHAPGPESSVIKVMWSEAHQRLLDLALEILGPFGQQRLDAGAEARGFWVHEYLCARAETIYAGTSEVQRNVIAQRLLGLPKAEA